MRSVDPESSCLPGKHRRRQKRCSSGKSPLSVRVEAQLVFDSEHRNWMTPVRGDCIPARQLLYKAGSVCIDMHIQPKLGSISAFLTGQVLDSKRPNRIMRGVSVSLWSAGSPISHMRTNDFGEFNFGVAPLRDLHLAFGIGTRKTLMVAVPDMQANPALHVLSPLSRG
jgi:hypothetical protein